MEIILKPLPNVTGLPDELIDQKSINYIKNGELLEGAKTKNGSDGNLNRPSVQIQENVVVLDENIKLLAENSNSANQSIQQLEAFINQSGNTDLIEKVNEQSTQIENLQTSVVSIEQEQLLQNQNISTNTIHIGNKVEANGLLNIFEDLLFIKTKIGNTRDENINNQPQIGAEPSGIIKRLEDVTKQVLTNQQNIYNIQTDLNGVDVSTLKTDVEVLRSEIGDKFLAKPFPIYTRLDSLESKDSTIELKLSTIENSLGGRNVNQDLTSLEQAQSTTNDEISHPDTGILSRLNTIETKLSNPADGVDKKIADLNTKQSQLESDQSTTDVKINEINTFIGNEQTPSPTSLLTKLNELIAIQNDTSATVQDIQSEIGNASSGILGDIVLIKQRLTNLEARVAALEPTP